ncbi:NAD-dependent epimerase/dehydratase family protein [Seonamhaeicola marinus]|uniref:NAD-dependent epimerase/dehydratase family protein n=1 Tax=Seonamhaeicola marinus TaxID=1912246 RepID=A0A5D0IMX2_9FLAO|nr:NAD-dependent epimerase/dehydratase family protein [Seonamhaeicola marinus]TYA84260.1 NAD-dependent epimerase/dehydratase family protein [Seonamhaeicola marinus]
MKKSRREFLGISMMLGISSVIQASPLKLIPIEKTNKKLKILILGGTSFLGPHQIAYALERGHEVSIFTRGKTKPKIHTELFSKVEHLIGDRENNLEALKNRTWDVVIDNSGRKVEWTKNTANLLKDNVGYYMYTSSVSVYYPYFGNDFSESRKVVTVMPNDATEDQKPTYDYGIMKANSELAAIDAFGLDRAFIIRPHLIVGPGDPTDRFPYWLARIEKGGDLIIPGGKNEVVQYIDVRDLAEWMIRLVENKSTGTYNGSGPGFEMTTNVFVKEICKHYNSSINFIQIDDLDFLKENRIIGIQPWVIQLPEYAGMSKTDTTKAIASGLTYRTLSDTVKATKTWWYSNAVSQARRDNILTAERSFMRREKDILKKWNTRKN